jgi:hypothetical protein
MAVSRPDNYEIDKKNNNVNNVLYTNNSSYNFTKENINNFTVDEILEMNVDPDLIEEVSLNKEMHSEPNNNLNTVNKSNAEKIRTNSHRSMERDKEIKDLLNIQDELMQKLSVKEEELASYKDACSKLLKISAGHNNKTVPLEKYEILLNYYSEEQEKLKDITVKYEVMKRDYDVFVARLNAGSIENSTINTKNSNILYNGKDSNINIPPLNFNAINMTGSLIKKDFIPNHEESNFDYYDLEINDTQENNYVEKLNKSAFDNKVKDDTKFNINKNNLNKIVNKTISGVKQQSDGNNFLSMLNYPGNSSGVTGNDSIMKTQNSGNSKHTENTFVVFYF